MTHKKEVSHYGTQTGIMKNTVKDTFVVSFVLALVALLLAYYHCGGWVYFTATYSGIYLSLSLWEYKMVVTNTYKTIHK